MNGSGAQERGGAPGDVGLADAAVYLGLPEDTVRALADGNFLETVGQDAQGPRFDIGELRAFMVWNVEDVEGTGGPVVDLSTDADRLDALLQALDDRSGEMAEQAYEVFADVFPESRSWLDADRAQFIEQAQGRLEAILAVSSQGFDVDEALASDLQSVGVAAAREGAPLPQLFVVLRVSRDLVVQAAADITAERGRDWALALSLLLSRVLPSTDRLTDSLAKGYWSAVVGRQRQARARYQNVVENASDGVYEVDLDGRIRYANPQLGLILGRRRLDDLVGSLLSDVMAPVDGRAVSNVGLHPAGGSDHAELTMARPDGVRRVLHVRTQVLREGTDPVGYQGVVRDVSAAHDLGAEKDRLLASLLGDLRLALVRLSDLGAGLESEGGRLGPEGLRNVGRSVVGNVERVSDLTERVAQASRMVAEVPLLTPRPVELAGVVQEALAATRADVRHVDVQVPTGLTVMADSDGLQRVVRHLVEKAILAGPPVRLEVEGVRDGQLYLAVSQPGASVPHEDGGSEPVEGEQVLVRTLAEAMGGRVWQDTDSKTGTRTRLTVPVANRRKGDEAVRL